MSGKQAFAPCGHVGEVIFGNYVACKICDGKKRPAIEIQLPNGYPVNPKNFEDFALGPPKAIYNFVSDNPAKVTIDNGARPGKWLIRYGILMSRLNAAYFTSIITIA